LAIEIHLEAAIGGGVGVPAQVANDVRLELPPMAPQSLPLLPILLGAR
jgi:hypothetical protein